VREILLSVDELGDFARASQDGIPGRLRIGVIPTIAPYLLPTIIGDLSKLHPEIDIHMRETQTEKLIRELEHGLLDTAIVTGCETWAGFSVTTLKSRLVGLLSYDLTVLLKRPQWKLHRRRGHSVMLVQALEGFKGANEALLTGKSETIIAASILFVLLTGRQHRRRQAT
jgi:DNA-binding transcriptional LysR family regulator